MKEEIKRSKYWNELVEIWEQEFPKGECRERGGALVLLSYAEIALQKQKVELEQVVREETIEKCLATLALWRPYFYRDKITDEDIKEIKKLLEDLKSKYEESINNKSQ